MNKVINVAFENDKEIKALKKSINGGFLELARLLYENKENKYYKTLDYDTFEAYIAQEDLGFERRSVYRLIGIYETFILKYNVPPVALSEIDYSKLDVIRPLLTEGNIEDWISKAKTLSRSDLETEIKETFKLPTPPLPKDKYDVIYADPPWEYDVDLAATRSPENHYQVMNLEELVAFGEKVKKISNTNCTLFMWTTAPKLNWVNDILEAWGFDYKTNLIWDKVSHNMGHYSSVRHEILIIAGKGNAAPTCDGTTIQSIDSVQSIDKSAVHSKKPVEFYEIIEKLYPDSKKIELFARNQRDGWDVWGNESGRI